MEDQNLKKIEEIKVEGNTFFKQKNLVSALQKFSEGAQEIENLYQKELEIAKSEIHKDKPIIKLYLQLLTNKALCELNLKQLENVLNTTKLVRQYDVNNSKAVYRNALANKQLAEQILQNYQNDLKSVSIEDIKKVNTFYEEARFQLEILSKLEPSNKPVIQELSDIVKSGVRVKLQIRELKKQNPDQFPDAKLKPQSYYTRDENQEKYDKEQEEKQKQQQQKANANKRIVNELDTEKLQKISDLAVQNNTDQLINDTNLPDSPSTFEKNIAAFKKTPEKLFKFIQKLNGDYISKLYSKKDIPVEILLSIVTSLQNQGVQENKEKCLDIITGITKTNKFKLCTMCMTKSEKQKIKNLLDEIQASEQIYKDCNV